MIKDVDVNHFHDISTLMKSVMEGRVLLNQKLYASCKRAEGKWRKWRDMVLLIMNISFNLSAVVYITDIFNSRFWNRINGVEAFLVSATLPEEGNHIDLAGH